MINIKKSKEPRSLTEYKQQARGNPDLPQPLYEDLDKDSKHELLGSLLREQGHICCYCMARISKEISRIEHWHCQSRYPKEQLDYGNLLAACQGNEGGPYEYCDVEKGDRDISYNPACPAVDIEAKLSYLRNGRIVANENGLSRDIKAILNLNHARLMENRSKTIRAIQRKLNKKPGERTPHQIKKLIHQWESANAQGQQQPYAGVALYWLRKRLR